ncbi:MAG: peptidoglycan bridge formation glycyltransferase FemA/FemB family protein [Oscillospiraceae bacterium]
MFEILTPAQYPLLDRFVESHPQGGFTQLSSWRLVKSNWDFAAVAVRDARGELAGTMSVLMQKVPITGTTFLYAPRGPVCDPHDAAVLRELKAGIDFLAEKHCAHAFKMDPDLLFSDEQFSALARELGFTQTYGPNGFEGIQARFNYRLYLAGRTEAELLAGLTQGCRRKVRIAIKNGVEVRAVGSELLPEFARLMKITGERDGFSIRPIAYFERFLSALAEHARLYMGFYQGQAVCGALATNCSGKCCYVYGASDNLFREVMPNYLMQWEMIRWAAQTGCVVYDFQGVSGNLSPENNHMYGLYQFKRGFSGQLDELAGEFDLLYRPTAARAVATAAELSSKLRSLRHRWAAPGR